LEKAFREIESKVEQRFVYTTEMLEASKPVTIDERDASLQKILNVIFAQQPLEYLIDDHFIKVRFKAALPQLTIDVQGKVIDENGQPLQGITITAKQNQKSTATDKMGVFLLPNVSPNDLLVISSIGYNERTVYINGRKELEIQMQVAYSPLDETIIMAYGTTTKRLNTGSISKVSAEEISKQPVSNPLSALQGRVPGLMITQSNGYANSPLNIQLRGQNSISQGSQPFFIIDGVPFAAQNNPINQVTNASNAGVNPFYTINPGDIESIEILKDADATSIYGSRGANGVILITTKKGLAGKTKVQANIYSGWSKVTRTMNMLNTEQYVAMRKEAFLNDGITPSSANATDILVWDPTRYTNMKELFLGGTAKTLDANLSVSGGNTGTQFIISGGLHRETTVLPIDLADYRASTHAAVNHSSTNKKFTVNLATNYSFTKNTLPGIDPSGFINRPPNMKLYDEIGGLNWQEGGVSFSNIFSEFGNPLTSLKTKYVGNYYNLSSSLLVAYKILSNLHFRTNLGYNFLSSDEIRTNPSASLDPFSGQLPSSYFGNASHKTWIIEPQMDYFKTTGFGKFTLLIGGTWQKKTGTGIAVNAIDYRNDLLLNSISGASSITTSNFFDEYRYTAVFGRVNYNWHDKYILNITGRRDGSSRFGPNKQFNTFGALGAAWIFSNEKLFANKIDWLSFGKLRASYGTTGNDAIGNYQFLDTWTASTLMYQGVPVILPSALFNPQLAWETNKKFETAIELGFLDQGILLSFAYFLNRSGNQLIFYNLPVQTGFTGINKNLDALVENKGYELSLETRNIETKQFKWTSNLNVTINRNKLLEFPGLATSSYANSLVIGESLSIKKLYGFLGVDAATGLYRLFDANGSGSLNSVDRIMIGNTQPKFFGGFQNTVSFKGIELDVLLQFIKQKGLNYLGTVAGLTPGSSYANQPIVVLDRWQKQGDINTIQKFTTKITTEGVNLANSEAAYADASFIRCKNVSLSYSVPKTLAKGRIEVLKLYVHVQNPFTITNYVGADPESQNMFRMPPLKTIVAGVQLIF
jgi:TonB-linked SusC/RagA family outer membrane protein